MTNFDKILREFEKYDYHEAVYADAKEATAEWLDYHRQDVQDSDSIEDLESRNSTCGQFEPIHGRPRGIRGKVRRIARK